MGKQWTSTDYRKDLKRINRRKDDTNKNIRRKDEILKYLEGRLAAIATKSDRANFHRSVDNRKTSNKVKWTSQELLQLRNLKERATNLNLVKDNKICDTTTNNEEQPQTCGSRESGFKRNNISQLINKTRKARVLSYLKRSLERITTRAERKNFHRAVDRRKRSNKVVWTEEELQLLKELKSQASTLKLGFDSQCERFRPTNGVERDTVVEGMGDSWQQTRLSIEESENCPESPETLEQSNDQDEDEMTTFLHENDGHSTANDDLIIEEDEERLSETIIEENLNDLHEDEAALIENVQTSIFPLYNTPAFEAVNDERKKSILAELRNQFLGCLNSLENINEFQLTIDSQRLSNAVLWTLRDLGGLHEMKTLSNMLRSKFEAGETSPRCDQTENELPEEQNLCRKEIMTVLKQNLEGISSTRIGISQYRKAVDDWKFNDKFSWTDNELLIFQELKCQAIECIKESIHESVETSAEIYFDYT